MKKLFTVILIATVCCGAFAQESELLDKWSDKIEQTEDDVVSAFSYFNATYNYNLAAAQDYIAHGWGLEVSSVHIGFNPWKNGRFTFGLFGMSFNWGYLQNMHAFGADMEGKIVPLQTFDSNNKSSCFSISYMFPLGYIQSFGASKWSAALLVSPGICWTTYKNDTLEGNIRKIENLKYERGRNSFYLDVKAMIWYDNVGVVAKYTFPKGMQGAGIVSAGISLRI